MCHVVNVIFWYSIIYVKVNESQKHVSLGIIVPSRSLPLNSISHYLVFTFCIGILFTTFSTLNWKVFPSHKVQFAFFWLKGRFSLANWEARICVWLVGRLCDVKTAEPQALPFSGLGGTTLYLYSHPSTPSPEGQLCPCRALIQSWLMFATTNIPLPASMEGVHTGLRVTWAFVLQGRW